MFERTKPARPDDTRDEYMESASGGSHSVGPAGRGRLWIGGILPIAALLIAGVLTVPNGDERIPDVVAELAEIGESPVALPLEETERVLYWVERFTTDQRPTFEYFLTRDQVFGGMIREKLRARGMPEELIYLAMIESGLRPRATSQVAAVGVWQFMDPTARQYGLQIDDWVDERRDPVKATDAALDYLQWLHGRYDSWYLAAAAYNAGPTRVDRAVRRATGEEAELDLFWEIQHMLPRETREHVPRMVAATLLARRAGEHGFEASESLPSFAYDQVWVPGATPLREVASAVRVEASAMRALNPHLLRGMTPPGGPYAVRVPVGSTHRVVASLGGGPWGTNLADDDG